MSSCYGRHLADINSACNLHLAPHLEFLWHSCKIRPPTVSNTFSFMRPVQVQWNVAYVHECNAPSEWLYILLVARVLGLRVFSLSPFSTFIINPKLHSPLKGSCPGVWLLTLNSHVKDQFHVLNNIRSFQHPLLSLMLPCFCSGLMRVQTVHTVLNFAQANEIPVLDWWKLFWNYKKISNSAGAKGNSIFTFITSLFWFFSLFTPHQNEWRWGNFGFGDPARCFREPIWIQAVHPRQRSNTQ